MREYTNGPCISQNENLKCGNMYRSWTSQQNSLTKNFSAYLHVCVFVLHSQVPLYLFSQPITLSVILLAILLSPSLWSSYITKDSYSVKFKNCDCLLPNSSNWLPLSIIYLGGWAFQFTNLWSPRLDIKTADNESPRDLWRCDDKIFKVVDTIYPTPPLGQDMTQGHFLSGVSQVLNSEFSFS